MSNTCTTDHEVQSCTRPERASSYSPRVDIFEASGEFILRADLPGATADSIDIDLDGGMLSLRARVQPRAHGRPLVQEYGVGDFERSFRIGEGIDSAQIGAELADGVLTVRLPKTSAYTPRKISVKQA